MIETILLFLLIVFSLFELACLILLAKNNIEIFLLKRKLKKIKEIKEEENR